MYLFCSAVFMFLPSPLTGLDPNIATSIKDKDIPAVLIPARDHPDNLLLLTSLAWNL